VCARMLLSVCNVGVGVGAVWCDGQYWLWGFGEKEEPGVERMISYTVRSVLSISSSSPGFGEWGKKGKSYTPCAPKLACSPLDRRSPSASVILDQVINTP
jgi:hypothetical protein